MKKLILIVTILCLVNFTWGAVITQFSHFTGYDRTLIEIYADSPIPLSVAIQESGSTETIAVKHFDAASSFTIKYSELDYDTQYGIGVKINGKWLLPEDTGYYVHTLERWHYAKRAFKDNDAAPIFINALGNVVPEKTNDVLDEVERLTVRALVKIYNDKQITEQKNFIILLESLK